MLQLCFFYKLKFIRLFLICCGNSIVGVLYKIKYHLLSIRFALPCIRISVHTL